MSCDGILLIDKPKGWTSHDVVAKIRGILKSQAGQKVKVGHTGTLDPLATGLMVIVVGNYCKRAAEFSKLDKTYEVTMRLGETSETGDSEGQKTQVSPLIPSEIDIENALADFTTTYEQVPPVYSAIKIGGERAYKLARTGKEIKLEPRKVTVHETKLNSYSYPIVGFTAKVSSGTYVRSLVEDIGGKLATGAYTSALKRISVNGFSLKVAINIDNVSIDKIAKI